MSSSTDSQSKEKANAGRSSFKLPKKEDMTNALRLAAEAGELTDEERRYLFRELARQLLDPSSEEVSTLSDNEENVLGYFEPVLQHFRAKAEQYSSPLDNPEELMVDAVPFEEVVNQVLHSHQTYQE